MKCTIISEGSFSLKELEQLMAKPGIVVRDIYKTQLEELFEVQNPSSSSKAKMNDFIKQKSAPDARLRGSWVFYPWLRLLIHIVNEPDLMSLLTNRNKLLIDENTQTNLYESRAIILGMSVGNAIAVSMAHSGFAKQLVLADFDQFSTTNLNRVRVGLTQVGIPKLQSTIHELYEINPYLQIQAMHQGVSEENISDLISSRAINKQVIFDEMDDFRMKIQIRKAAKVASCPVVMLTSLGDNLLIDVERYDLNPDYEPFAGALGNLDTIELSEMTPEMIKRLAVQTVGIENIPTKALKTLQEIGETLVGRPQLYSTVTLDGGFAAYLHRLILSGSEISGRFRFSYAPVFNLPPTDLIVDDERKSIISELTGE